MIAQFTEKESFLHSPSGGLNHIEQLQIVALKNCTKTNNIHLTGINQNEHKALLTKTNCKMWNCPACAARNARKWIARIINGVNQLGGDWYFFTITSSGSYRGISSVKAIRKGWKLLYNRILALYGKDASILYYCKVWEQHKDGSFHLHLLANFRVTKRWLKDNCFSCGLGHQAHIRAIQNTRQICGYVAKYTLKNAAVTRGGIIIPKGLRRIETSHKWPILPKLATMINYEWIFESTREKQLHRADVLRWDGYQVIDKVKE